MTQQVQKQKQPSRREAPPPIRPGYFDPAVKAAREAAARRARQGGSPWTR